MFETVRQMLVSWGQQNLNNTTLLALGASAYGFLMLCIGGWIFYLVQSPSMIPVLFIFGSQAFCIFTYFARDITLKIWAFCTPLGIFLAVSSTVILAILSFIFLLQNYKEKPEIYAKFLAKQPKWKRPVYFLLFVFHDGKFPVIRGRRGKWSAHWD